MASDRRTSLHTAVDIHIGTHHDHHAAAEPSLDLGVVDRAAANSSAIIRILPVQISLQSGRPI
ncbi:MAG: hypothetical protein WBX01_14570 [Nitrososphaeraceae archaeon]